MPQRKSGIKALRINKRRRLRNLKIKTELKKTLKNYKSLVVQDKLDEAKASLKIVYKKLDKACKRNILHKNTASRRKSQLAKLPANKR